MTPALNYMRARLNWPLLLLGAWILVLFARDDLHVIWHTYFDVEPWTSPFVEVEPTVNGPPNVLYAANARRPVSGTWTASVETPDGGRIATRKGRGDYSPSSASPRSWTWSGFFENGLVPPKEPQFPYRICVNHTVQTLDTNVRRYGKKACSSVYDPAARSIRK